MTRGAGSRVWRAVTTLGRAHVEPAQYRALAGSNRFFFLSAAVSLPWVAVLATFPSPWPPGPAATHVLLLGAWAVCLWLNARGALLLSTLIGLVAPVAQYAFLAHQFGRDAGFQLLLIAVPSLSFAIGVRWRLGLRIGFSVLAGSLLVWVYVGPAFVQPVIATTHGEAHLLALGNILTVLLGFNTLAYFNDKYLRHERERSASLLMEAQAAADTDALTGALNRRGVEALAGAAARAGETALALIDVDRFKRVNDALGHPAGDAVLAGVARTLRDVVGTRGQVARWGGEEFLVLLPSTTWGQAQALAEEVRAEVEMAEYGVASEAVVTVSVGLAFAERPVATRPLIETADACLYEAKASGRNVVVARELSTGDGRARARGLGHLEVR